MKALSIWQPWASLLMAGIKSYETRSWTPPMAVMGERIAIHAAKAVQGMAVYCGSMVTGPIAMHRWAAGQRLGLPGAGLPLGAILGTAVLAFALATDSDLAADILPGETALGDWSPGRWAWRLTDHQPLATPIPCRGMQGLFEVPDHILTQLPTQGNTP